jgi:hypothetical protein
VAIWLSYSRNQYIFRNFDLANLFFSPETFLISSHFWNLRFLGLEIHVFFSAFSNPNIHISFNSFQTFQIPENCDDRRSSEFPLSRIHHPLVNVLSNPRQPQILGISDSERSLIFFFPGGSSDPSKLAQHSHYSSLPADDEL